MLTPEKNKPLSLSFFFSASILFCFLAPDVYNLKHLNHNGTVITQKTVRWPPGSHRAVCCLCRLLGRPALTWNYILPCNISDLTSKNVWLLTLIQINYICLSCANLKKIINSVTLFSSREHRIHKNMNMKIM